jgi:hypothetical protein
MSKKFVLILVALLVLPGLLAACGTDSADTAQDYVEALLKGDAEKAQSYACADYQDATAAFAEIYAGLAAQNLAIRSLDLKYDLGKGNNAEEIIVTGSYDLVELNAEGKEIADSEDEFELASSTRDKRDLDGDGDDEDKINTRIVLEMKKDDGDWCVEKLEGGYFMPPAAE